MLADVTFCCLLLLTVSCGPVNLSQKLHQLEICWKYTNLIPSNILKRSVSILFCLGNEIDLHFSFRLAEKLYIIWSRLLLSGFPFSCQILCKEVFIFCFEFWLSFISRVQLILSTDLPLLEEGRGGSYFMNNHMINATMRKIYKCAYIIQICPFCIFITHDILHSSNNIITHSRQTLHKNAECT